ncbi:hypothetical protein Pmani_024686 [Petrolisthes manimaculis]|uniref:Uncharacterized protein n=1 Tax=Petrolisthes manimaculis TaxID=1843537 RepID=A0AAE1TZ43_9EUCA|nr:hypothetical protein Pmani_024686 [Petrolisthes manimaculis]
MDITMTRSVPLELTHLPWQDVIFQHILPHLSVKDLCRLRGTSKMFLHMFNDYMASCKRLDFTGFRVSEQGFKKVVENCENLQRLSMADCDWVTDALLMPVFRNNTSLLYVDLCRCKGLSGAAFQILVVKCKKLNTLLVGDCPWFSCGCWQVLILHQTQLQCINMSGCWNTDLETLEQFFQKYPQLKMVDMSKIEKLTDMHLYLLASHCPGLEVLNVSGCWRLTDQGLKKVVDYCPRLRMLNVMHCRRVTEQYLCSLLIGGINVTTWYCTCGNRYEAMIFPDEMEMKKRCFDDSLDNEEIMQDR